MKAFRWFILCAAIAGLLAGGSCSRPTGPQPEQILIFDGERTYTVGRDHPAYAPLARKLDDLIAGMDRPLYAYYPPERFEAEIAPQPHLAARYGRNVVLIGKGYQVTAAQLVVVVADGAKIILTRPEGNANWEACQDSEVARFDALIKAVKGQTGVDL